MSEERRTFGIRIEGGKNISLQGNRVSDCDEGISAKHVDGLSVAGNVVEQRNFSSLARELTSFGFSRDEIENLRRAIETDSSGGSPKYGDAIKNWMSRALTKAGKGLLKVSGDTAAAVLTKLITQHMGLP